MTSSASRTLAILFADIGGSTALYETLGDAEAHRRVAESLTFMRTATERHGGTLLRTVGDASLASFGRCDDAAFAARDMQRLHAPGPLSIRVGFHVGPVIPDGGDVYGGAVNVAARIAAFARPEEIVLSEDAVRALSGAHRARTTLLDTRRVKGVSRPLGLHRLDWREPRDDPATAVAGGAFASPLQHTARVVLARGPVVATLDAARPALAVGRAEGSDVRVDDEHASRRHARLELHRGQCLLIDESTNGTWLLREGRPPVLVRRDTIVLEGEGRLGLGAPPAQSGATPLTFVVESG